MDDRIEEFVMREELIMLVSKSDGSQTTDPQRDALPEAGVEEAQLYEDLASGKKDDRSGLAACL
jgi:DNA invertase Pin-like site-specific DNA recombinase